MGRSKDVFVSFSRRGQTAARSLIEELRGDGFSVSDGAGGYKVDADWQKAVEQAVRGCGNCASGK